MKRAEKGGKSALFALKKEKKAMNAYKKYNDCAIKYRQIVYLIKTKGEAVELVAKITDYANSTVRTYAYKFADLLDEAEEMFKGSRKINYDGIEFACKELFDEASEKFYLLRAFNNYGELLFSKVGTTTRPMIKRMQEHIKAYAKIDVACIVVDRVYDCGDVPAEGFESWFRAMYIRRWGKEFRKNDRFFGPVFDLDEADALFEQYKNMGE